MFNLCEQSPLRQLLASWSNGSVLIRPFSKNILASPAIYGPMASPVDANSMIMIRGLQMA